MVLLTGKPPEHEKLRAMHAVKSLVDILPVSRYAMTCIHMKNEQRYDIEVGLTTNGGGAWQREVECIDSHSACGPPEKARSGTGEAFDARQAASTYLP